MTQTERKILYERPSVYIAAIGLRALLMVSVPSGSRDDYGNEDDDEWED